MNNIPENEFRNGFDEELASLRDELLRVAMYLTRNTADAMDLRQDTVLRAMENSEKFQSGTNMGAWLRRIMINIFINKIRREKLTSITTSWANSNVIFEGTTGEETRRMASRTDYETGGFSDEILNAIGALPVEFRDALVLADVEGLSYVEISATLSIPYGTVLSRIHRARRRLRDVLREHARSQGVVRKAA